MFQWDKKLLGLDIPASSVLKLHRSISEMHIGLPGLPAEEAFAYLCIFAQGNGFRVVVAFHLQPSGTLAFYVNDGGLLDEKRAAKVVDEGFGFIESMGFLLSDLDIDLRSPGEKEVLWDSLPLKSGDRSKYPARSDSSSDQQKEGESDPPENINQGVTEEALPLNTSLVKRKTGDANVVNVRLRESLGRMLSSF